MIFEIASAALLLATLSDDAGEALPLVRHTEAPGPGLPPVTWATGTPVRFQFAHNTETSPYFGPEFAQDVEPAGRFVTTLGVEPEHLPRGWIHGEMSFANPLVLALVWPVEGSYKGAEGWKHRLSNAFGGKTGVALSRALLRAGFDGIVTVTEPNPGSRLEPYLSEIVDLRVVGRR